MKFSAIEVSARSRYLSTVIIKDEAWFTTDMLTLRGTLNKLINLTNSDMMHTENLKTTCQDLNPRTSLLQGTSANYRHTVEHHASFRMHHSSPVKFALTEP